MKPTNLHLPEGMAQKALENIEASKEYGGQIPTGIPLLNRASSMFTGGKVAAYQAVTSHGKSTLKLFIAQHMAKQCKQNEIVLFVTYEDSIEMFTQKIMAGYTAIPLRVMHGGKLSDDDMKKLKVAATMVQGGKLWVLGHSEDDNEGWERMTMTSIFEAMDFIRAQGLFVKAVFIDYLQTINMTDLDHRYFGGATALYSETIQRIKVLAIKSRAFVMYSTQVAREILKDRENKMPQLGDGKYTGKIEEVADAVISGYIPWKYPEMHGDMLLSPMDRYPAGVIVTPDLYMLEVQKSKWDETPTLVPLSADWNTNTFTEWRKQ